jgi:hypothetical protein
MIQNKNPKSKIPPQAVPRRVIGLGAIGRGLGPRKPGEVLSNLEAATGAMAKATGGNEEKIRKCIERFGRHLENVKNGIPQSSWDEHDTIDAILDYPLASLSNGLIVGDENSAALERLMKESPNERVREFAKEKLDRAIAFIDILF